MTVIHAWRQSYEDPSTSRQHSGPAVDTVLCQHNGTLFWLSPIQRTCSRHDRTRCATHQVIGEWISARTWLGVTMLSCCHHVCVSVSTLVCLCNVHACRLAFVFMCVCVCVGLVEELTHRHAQGHTHTHARVAGSIRSDIMML